MFKWLASLFLTITSTAYAQTGCFGYMPELSNGRLANGVLLLCPPTPLTPVQWAYFRRRDDILSLRINQEANQCHRLSRDPGSMSESMRPIRPDETEAICVARVKRETPLPPVPAEAVRFLARWHIAPDGSVEAEQR